MERNGVMDARTDIPCLEVSQKSVARRRTHHVKVIRVLGSGPFQRREETGTLETPVVCRGVCATEGSPSVKVTQFDSQNGSLQRIQPLSHADEFMFVFRGPAVIPQLPHLG